MRGKGWICVLMFWAGMSHSAWSFQDAQSSADSIIIKEVFLLGNKKTKGNIIMREMSLKKGFTLADTLLEAYLEEDKQRIYNTNLFNEVEIQTLYTNEKELILLVKVSERWYIYPSFKFELADRNFNDWWVNQNRDLSRVNFGLKYQQYNFRGRRELLNLVFQVGFVRNFLIGWRIPYIEKSQKHGLAFTYSYKESRNVGFRTENHIRQFIGEDRILRRSTRSGITWRFRKSYYNVHRVQVTFDHKAVDDTVALINPNYFNGGASLQRNFDISYQFTRDLRNNNNYATRGSLFDFRAEKTGLGVFNELDLFDITVGYTKYFDLGNKFSAATGLTAYSSWPRNQPYESYLGLGFDQKLVRGFEQDLIEGPRYILYKSTLRRQLFKFTRSLGKFMPLEQFRKIPFAFYAKVFFDAGYVENYPQYEISQRLSNQYLQSVGVGLDIVTIHDLVSRFEWSLNSENQVRFAFSAKADL